MSCSLFQVLAVEKELQLTELTLRETKKDLNTEKACYSKAYEDVSQVYNFLNQRFMAGYMHTSALIQ